ncbi:MAG: DUF1345 domain-containing protein [Pseudomonadota bacterium]
MDDAPISHVPRAVAPHTAGRRLLTSAIVGVGVGGAVGLGVPSAGWPIHFVSAWDAAGIALLGQAWWQIAHETAVETRKHAAREDPGRTVVWLIVLVASTISLFAAGFVMRHAHTITQHSNGSFCALLVLCLVAVVASWFLTHTAYTLRYAHLYYRDDDEGEGGLEFPGKEDPNGFDFAYFAFTLGMCFQTSDVAVTSHQIRRAVLAHALLSFLFNTVVVAVAVNLVLGFLN